MRSYNRYLAVAARVVRRSLKEGPRLQAERRGEMDLRFAKWEVSTVHTNASYRRLTLCTRRTGNRARTRALRPKTQAPWHNQRARKRNRAIHSMKESQSLSKLMKFVRQHRRRCI